MIVAINTKTEYGKQGTTGINPMPELSDDGDTAYGHGMEQALAWIKSYPLYANVEPCSLGDGRMVLESKWNEESMASSLLYGYESVTHVRQVVTIYPVNTIYENTGFEGGRKADHHD